MNKLIFKIAVTVLGAFLVVSFISATSIYEIQKNQKEQLLMEQAESIELGISGTIDPELLTWFFNYWRDHGSEMDLSDLRLYTSGGSGAEKWYEKHGDIMRRISGNGDRITVEEIETMSDEEKKEYAQTLYTVEYGMLHAIRKRYEMDKIVVFEYCGNNEAICYFLSVDQEGSENSAGLILPETLEYHPVVSQIVNVSKTTKGIEYFHASNDGDDYLSAVVPFELSDGRLILITSNFMWAEIWDEAVKNIKDVILNTLFYLIVISIVLHIILYMQVIKPLNGVRSVIRDYMKDKDSSNLKDGLKKLHGAPDELLSLSDDISKLSEELDDYHEEIVSYAEKKASSEAEMRVASTIQLSALPSVFPPFPDRKEFEIYASMNPCLDVGGDFYDFFMIDDDHLALVIADVSDKGVTAALFMMMTKTMIKTYYSAGNAATHPMELFEKINDELAESNGAGMFVTCWLGILTISTGEMRCSNAGHEYPAILRKNSEEGFSLLKQPHSPPLALYEGIPYKDEDFVLEKGDAVFVYTDGVTEAFSKDEVLYGDERMINDLNDAKDLSTEEIIDHMRKSISSYTEGAKQFDDITMLCLRYLG